jgi:predicted membrane protein (TIGR00267 family)
MERHELQLMPEVEEEELALIYEVKGFTAEKAKETAKIMMRDPAKALEVKVREELELTEAELTPGIDGWVTGSATAVGALIPIAPFLLLDADAAIWVSLFVSMSAHFAIGAARSLFTGRSVWASGRDMFVVGFGVAAVGYLIGEAITRIL